MTFMKFPSSRLASRGRSLRRVVLALVAVLPALAFTMAGDAQDPVMRAMRDELARSMAQLQLENLEKPYFISYRVQEARSQSVAAQFGSALGRNESRNRIVFIEIRVGTPPSTIPIFKLPAQAAAPSAPISPWMTITTPSVVSSGSPRNALTNNS